MMYRLKTTLENGKEFFGLFVYDLNERGRRRKLRKLSWITKDRNGKIVHNMEFIECTEYPKEAIFNPKKWIDVGVDRDLLKYVYNVENAWNLMKGEEDVKDYRENT